MINVNSVYEQVSALSRKGQAGYHNGAEFNEQQRLVQNMLFDYNMMLYEKDQAATDSLIPFLEEVEIPIVGGFAAYPADYRHRIRVSVGYISGTTTTYYTSRYLNVNGDQETLESYVRRPSAARKRFYHTLTADGIKIYPDTFVGKIKLRYFRQPANAVWGYTDDTTNIVETYNSSTSTDFEWGPEDESKLVDLFLYLKGIQTRHSELIQWVAMKNNIKNSD